MEIKKLVRQIKTLRGRIERAERYMNLDPTLVDKLPKWRKQLADAEAKLFDLL